MNIHPAPHATAAGLIAAEYIARQIRTKPDCVLGLATGSTPIGTYQNLVRFYQEGSLNFSQVKIFNLDEYKGLSGNNAQSYRYFMQEHLFRHVNIKPENTFIPDGTQTDADAECRRYEETIASLGGIDLQLLGLGHNGHIGFNEPSDSFAKATHCVDLAPSTINANKRFFEREEDVPRQAYTMGIGTIMSARKIILLVCGPDKADILRRALYGPVTPRLPASILQFHPDVTVIADEAALSGYPDGTVK